LLLSCATFLHDPDIVYAMDAGVDVPGLGETVVGEFAGGAATRVLPEGTGTEIIMSLRSYVIITPAPNEGKFIGLTLDSVTTQSVTPKKWIIVSDGSTDGTDEIVRSYAERYAWIELVRMPERRERDFAGKVHAFTAGFEHVRNTDYDVVCSL